MDYSKLRNRQLNVFGIITFKIFYNWTFCEQINIKTTDNLAGGWWGKIASKSRFETVLRLGPVPIARLSFLTNRKRPQI